MIYATVQDVIDLRGEVQPIVQQLDAAIAQCSQLSDQERANWIAFKARWDAYYAATDYLGAFSQLIYLNPVLFASVQDHYNVGLGLRDEARQWQAILATRKCKQLAPPLPKEPGEEGSGIPWYIWAALVIGGVFVVNAVTGGAALGYAIGKRRARLLGA